MAKRNLFSKLRDLDARAGVLLKSFEMEDEEGEDAAPRSGIAGKVAAGAAVAGTAAAVSRPELAKKAAKSAANTGLKVGAKGLRKGAAGMAGLRRKLHGLDAALDGKLQEFGLDPSEYVGKRTSRKKKRRAITGAAMAGAAVGGGMAIANRRAEIREGARTAGFRGMRQGAKVLKQGAKAADKVAQVVPGKAAKKGAAAVSAKLGKSAKALRKGSMKLFDAGRISRVAHFLVANR